MIGISTLFSSRRCLIENIAVLSSAKRTREHIRAWGGLRRREGRLHSLGAPEFLLGSLSTGSGRSRASCIFDGFLPAQNHQ